ncbi:MAG: ATP-dependent Clp protease proteolytic subunit [Comamonas sp.]|jgi:hypothetical protein|nr:ATP-dependent Clp protease proteolytic subunit [Comamonas sp.]
MSLKKLPKLPQMSGVAGIEFDLSPQALSKWNPALAMDEEEGDNVINILDPIGYDAWTGEGTSARRIEAALRSIGRDRDVVVNINSPGGSLFEGNAIYSLLRMHRGKVTVRILGIAASAALLQCHDGHAHLTRSSGPVCGRGAGHSLRQKHSSQKATAHRTSRQPVRHHPPRPPGPAQGIA